MVSKIKYPIIYFLEILKQFNIKNLDIENLNWKILMFFITLIPSQRFSISLKVSIHVPYMEDHIISICENSENRLLLSKTFKIWLLMKF